MPPHLHVLVVVGTIKSCKVRLYPALVRRGRDELASDPWVEGDSDVVFCLVTVLKVASFLSVMRSVEKTVSSLSWTVVTSFTEMGESTKAIDVTGGVTGSTVFTSNVDTGQEGLRDSRFRLLDVESSPLVWKQLRAMWPVLSHWKQRLFSSGALVHSFR